MVKVSWVADVGLITDWLAGLDDRSHELVIAALELLAERGPLLGRPLVDTVTSSRHNNMKELRHERTTTRQRRPNRATRTVRLRPATNSDMLVAGNKQGRWKRWYDQNIPIANDLFDTHLNKLKQTKQQKGRKHR
jgi:hypothetical protein